MTYADHLIFARSKALHILANCRAYRAQEVWDSWQFMQSLNARTALGLNT